MSGAARAILRQTKLYLAELRPAELDFCGGASSFLQSDFWGSFKARFGWKAFSFSAEWKNPNETSGRIKISDGIETSDRIEISGEPLTVDSEASGTVLPLLVLYRRLALRVGFAYVPWGPELPSSYNGSACHSAAAELAAALRSTLPKNTAFIRFDFPWFVDEPSGKENHEESPRTAVSSSFSRAAANVQPPDTVLVDLAPDESVILGNMKSKWRYNIGLAEKKGVTVRSMQAASHKKADEVSANPGSDDLASFYQIYRETAARDGISIHGIEYYRTLFEEAAKHNVDARLYMASHEGEDLAGIVTLFRNKESIYLYGASSNNKRNLMAPYALQWQAMKDAKAAGCQYYDLFGIPPSAPEEAPDHPMAGLYRFKTGFIGEEEGGKIVHRPGSWDYSCRPLVKALYSAAEKTRKKIWDIKKRLKRR